MFDKKAYMRQWIKDNPEKIKKYREKNSENHKRWHKLWVKNNPEYYKRYSKIWKENNPERKKENDKQYRKRNRERIRERDKLFYKNNREKWVEQGRQRRKNNWEEIKRYQNQWSRNKRKTDLRFNLNNRMSFAIWNVLKNNKAGKKWEDLVEYTLNDLIKRLKRTMPKGYTWQDFLDGKLQIDHIIPKSIFNFTKHNHTDFKRCWDLKNLRLLPAKENLIKGSKLSKPFQPTLRL